MTEQEILEILQSMTVPLPTPLVYKLYYDADGRVVTYSTEDLSGQYIEITREQYAEARSDVVIKDGKIIQTHIRNHVFKLEKSEQGIRCSKYDISIIADSGSQDGQYWKQAAYEIIRGNN
jgi:hypothetical protein